MSYFVVQVNGKIRRDLVSNLMFLSQVRKWSSSLGIWFHQDFKKPENVEL